MRKYLYIILLFLSQTLYGQITINKSFSSAGAITTDATAFGYTGVSLTAGKLYLFIVIATGTTNNGTITATTTTWTNISNTGDATRRIQIFRCLPASNVTGEDISIGSFGGGSTGYTIAMWEVSGMPITGTNGADAIVQAVTGSGTASANPSITMSAISNPRNAVIAVFSNSLNPFGGAAESGWTEDFDGGYTTPDAGSYIMSRFTTTDNTPSITASASDWIGVAIEIKSTQRRLMIIN